MGLTGREVGRLVLGAGRRDGASAGRLLRTDDSGHSSRCLWSPCTVAAKGGRSLSGRG